LCDICIKIWVGEVLFAEMLLFQRSVVFGQFKKTNNLKTILRAPFAISEYSGMNYIESCVLLGQTLYSFIQMKVKTLRQQKSANVSSSTSRQFYNFLSWLRVDGRILGELRVLIELQFWKVLQSAGWSHSCEGVLGLNECLSSFCPVAQGAEHDRENVNPAKKTLLCVSKQTIFAVQQLVLQCQEKALLQSSVKTNRLRDRVKCGGKTFTCRTENFEGGSETQKSSKDTGLILVMKMAT